MQDMSGTISRTFAGRLAHMGEDVEDAFRGGPGRPHRRIESNSRVKRVKSTVFGILVVFFLGYLLVKLPKNGDSALKETAAIPSRRARGHPSSIFRVRGGKNKDTEADQPPSELSLNVPRVPPRVGASPPAGLWSAFSRDPLNPHPLAGAIEGWGAGRNLTGIHVGNWKNRGSEGTGDKIIGWKDRFKAGKNFMKSAQHFVQFKVEPEVKSIAVSKSLRLLCLEGRAGLAYVPKTNTVHVQVAVEDLILGSRLSMVDGLIFVTKEFDLGIGKNMAISFGMDLITENYFFSAEPMTITQAGNWLLKRSQTFRLMEVKGGILGSGYLDMKVMGELEFENILNRRSPQADAQLDPQVANNTSSPPPIPPFPLCIKVSDVDFELKF